jgi:hypothetical protein
MGCVTRLVKPETLAPIKTACEAAHTWLLAAKAKKQAALASTNIILVNLEAKKAILDGFITEARNAMKVVPTEVISQCPQASILNNLLASVTMDPLENIYNMIADIGRLSASKTLLSLDIKEIDVAIDFLVEIIEDIDGVLG